MPNPRLANFDWTYASYQIPLRQVAVTYHIAFSRLGSSSTLALQILGYFVLDCGLQQLPRSFGQQLFQIAFRFDFCSLLERDHTNFHPRCILSFGAPRVRSPFGFFSIERMRLSLAPHPQNSVISQRALALVSCDRPKET